MNKNQKKGLTYGRLMLVMLALILLAVGAAWVRQWSLGPAVGIADVDFQAVINADYDISQATSTQLDQRKTITRKDTGSLLFVRTNAGNFAKLSVEFSPCLLDGVNVKFRIFQGTVYDPSGEVLRNFELKCINIDDPFDLDSGLGTQGGAPQGTSDLVFASRGPALHTVSATSNAMLALPSKELIAPQ